MATARGLGTGHIVWQADVGRLVVLEGSGFWACFRLARGCVDWVEVTVDRLVSAEFPGVRLSWRPPGPHVVCGPHVSGSEVRARGHPTSGCGVRRGDNGATHLGAGRVADGP